MEDVQFYVKNHKNANKRPKACQIIPVSEFDKVGPVVAEDDKHRYVLSDTGHVIKLRRKNCFSCPQSANFVIIFRFAKHKRVERYCQKHASNYGELPDIPQLEEYDLNSKQKRAVEAMQKWNNIKVNI